MYCKFCKSNETAAGFLPLCPNYATLAIHTAQDPDEWDSHSVAQPIVTATTFEQPSPGVPGKYFYGRMANPTRNALEAGLAKLDGGKYGFAFASGVGAAATLTGLLSAGDHILCCEDVYGGTSRLFRHITTRMGVETTFADFSDLDKAQRSIKPNTKMIWIETPTNPMMNIIDIAAVAKMTKCRADIILVVDNTFLTSYLQRPLDFGADVVMYSVTKYINGHCDVIMGAAVLNCDSLAQRLRVLQFSMGIVPSPTDCYLVLRSMKTLSLRMKQHKESGLKIAKWLHEHSKVKKVLHPELPDHNGHEIAKKQSAGHSGCFSFIHKGGLRESKVFLTSLKLFILAESLGGYESLAELPCMMTQTSIPAPERERLGITESLIRISVGLEDPDDLISDLDQAMNAAFAAGGKCEKCNKCDSCAKA